MCEFFARLELIQPRPKISLHAKNQPWESSSFFNQFCKYNIDRLNILIDILSHVTVTIKRCVYMLSVKGKDINSRATHQSVKLSILLHKMHFRNHDKEFVIGNLFETILPIPFCFLTLFILIYYIRRRCSLYQEIKRIPRELLLMESYQNHLKNLSIMAIINNFIIAILLFELIQIFLFQ